MFDSGRFNHEIWTKTTHLDAESKVDDDLKDEKFWTKWSDSLSIENQNLSSPTNMFAGVFNKFAGVYDKFVDGMFAQKELWPGQPYL